MAGRGDRRRARRGGTGTGRGRARADPHHRRAGTGEATAGDAVIEYTRDHLPVNMGVDTNQSDFTREQAEQLVGDIQEQLYETAKSQKSLHDLIAQAYDGRAWIALGYPRDRSAGTGCARTGSPPTPSA